MLGASGTRRAAALAALLAAGAASAAPLVVNGGFERTKQVQDFTPTPMTVSTVIYRSGVHPYTLEPIFTATSPDDKRKQRMFFFWYKPEEKKAIREELRKMNRPDLEQRLFAPPFGCPRQLPYPQSSPSRRPASPKASQGSPQDTRKPQHRPNSPRRPKR